MNKKQNKVSIGTTLWETSLTQLQLISHVSGRQGQVGVLIQTAVDEYIERITANPGFADKLTALRGQHEIRQKGFESTFDTLLDMAARSNRVTGEEEEPTPPEPKGKGTVTPFPGSRR